MYTSPDSEVASLIRSHLSLLLALCRAHGSPGEAEACDLLREAGFEELSVDGVVHGFQAGDPSSRVVLTAHIDTMHSASGPLEQEVERGEDGILRLAPDQEVQCLGADDAAGVAALLVLKNMRPGLRYVIFRGEERGLIGSAALATVHELWSGVTHVVSLDRRGVRSIITHQGGERCASDAFAEWLSGELHRVSDWGEDLWHADNSGIGTDSRSFTQFVPECTNLSVGYSCEHTPSETLDENHLVQLTEALSRVDWSAAEVERVP